MNPKYYRCINRGDSFSLFTVGKIYKCINPDNFQAYANFIDDRGKPNGWQGNNHNHFEPVTELEWNLQEGIITKVSKEDYSYLIELLKKLHII